MIKVGVGVEDRGDRQSQLPDLAQNSLVRPAWIDDDGPA